MKLKAILITAVTIAAAIFSGCKKEEGACESKFQNFQGYTLYTCNNDVETDMCESSGEHFWEDKSCINLGYLYYNAKNESWQIDEDNNGIPGPNGYWGDGTGSGNGTPPSGSGGTGGACDESGYKGPDFDIQVDSQCKAAYYYQCIGNNDGVKAACTIYKQWQADDSSIPNCPYCK
jgi:hypothetical protein